jgi:hypothetical protein
MSLKSFWIWFSSGVTEAEVTRNGSSLLVVALETVLPKSSCAGN